MWNGTKLSQDANELAALMRCKGKRVLDLSIESHRRQIPLLGRKQSNSKQRCTPWLTEHADELVTNYPLEDIQALV